MPSRDNPFFRLTLLESDSVEDTDRLNSRLLSFELVDEASNMDKCVVTIDNHDLRYWDDEVLRKGRQVRVDYGYGGLPAPARVMTVKSLKGFRVMTLELAGPGILMTAQKVNRRYRDQTYSQVVREVARRNGFTDDTMDVEETGTVQEVVCQRRESDGTFLARLAKRYGFEFWIDSAGLHWRTRPIDAAPVRRVEYVGPGLGDFIGEPTIENDVTRTYARASARAVDPVSGTTGSDTRSNDADRDRPGLATVSEAPEPPGRFNRESGAVEGGSPPLLAGDVVNPYGGSASIGALIAQREARAGGQSTGSQLTGTASIGALIAQRAAKGQPPEQRLAGDDLSEADDGDTERQAKTRYRETQIQAIKMRVTLVGDPTLAATQVVEVTGMGKRLSQRYYVKQAAHRMGGGQEYTTSLQLVADGHAGHTGGSGRPGGTGGSGERDELLTAALELVDLLNARVARAGTGQSPYRVVADTVSVNVGIYQREGLSATSLVRGAAVGALGFGKGRGDDAVVAAATKVISLTDGRGAEERASSAKVNSTRFDEDAGSLEELQEVEVTDPDTGEVVTTFRERQ